MRRSLLFGVLLWSVIAPLAAAGDCGAHRQRVAFIMDARLAGERPEALAADLAGGGPPPPGIIRLITAVYELPGRELRGEAREDRLDAFEASCEQAG